MAEFYHLDNRRPVNEIGDLDKICGLVFPENPHSSTSLPDVSNTIY